jgi:hypothetical protein
LRAGGWGHQCVSFYLIFAEQYCLAAQRVQQGTTGLGGSVCARSCLQQCKFLLAFECVGVRLGCVDGRVVVASVSLAQAWQPVLCAMSRGVCSVIVGRKLSPWFECGCVGSSLHAMSSACV